MKKWKSVFGILLALIMISITPLDILAAGQPKYIKEVRLSYGETADEAKSWLIENEYTVLEHNLNDGTGKDYVYLGYRTTNNPEEAITDMAIMDMKGGYSYSEYEKSLEKYQEDIQDMLDSFVESIKEFARNYEQKNNTALVAYKMLNQFQEDDTGELLGDYLINYCDDLEALTKIFMQGNQRVILYIEQMVALGCTDNSEEGNWIAKFSNADPYDYYEPEEYDDLARAIYTGWDSLRDKLLEAEKFKEEIGTTEEDIQKYCDLYGEEQYVENLQSLSYYVVFDMYKYDDMSMVEFFKQDPEDLDISQLYPLAYSMTAGQAKCAKYIGLELMIEYAMSTDESLEKMQEAFDEQLDEDGVTDVCSVYAGVDRSLFEEGGVALTNEALRNASSTGDNSWIQGNIDKAAEIAMYAIAGASVAASAASFVAYAVSLHANIMAQWANVSGWYTLEQFVALKVGDVGLYFAGNPIFMQLGIACIGVLLIVTAVYIGLEVYNYYHPEYTEIPRVIVDQKVVDEENQYVIYYAVMEKDHSYGDLNAFQGKQWNALYTTKDKNAGAPITTDMLVKKGDSSTQDGYKAVHYFGASNAFNLNSHTYKDKVDGIYMQYKCDEASLTASAFSSTSAVLFFGTGLLLGGCIGAVAVRRKKWKN